MCGWVGGSGGENGATGSPEAQGVACAEKMHSLCPLFPDHSCAKLRMNILDSNHSVCKPQSVRAGGGRLEDIVCHFDITSGNGYLGEK